MTYNIGDKVQPIELSPAMTEIIDQFNKVYQEAKEDMYQQMGIPADRMGEAAGLGLFGDYDFMRPEQPRRWMSDYLQHQGLHIMRGPAKPHNPLGQLFRFHGRKKRWIQIVGYKRMRQICRKSKVFKKEGV